MIRSLIISLIGVIYALSHSQVATAQTFDIVAGKGVGELELGMTKRKCIKILGKPYASTTFIEEERVCANFGYTTDSLPQFMEGFDECLEWDIPKKYPVFKLFFKDGILIFMTLTSYTMDEYLWRPARIKKSSFYSTKEEVLKKFGQPDYVRNDMGYDGFYTYWSKGIVLGFDENKLRVINIFYPMNL